MTGVNQESQRTCNLKYNGKLVVQFCIPPDTGGNERGYIVSRIIMLIPTGTSVGLTSVSLGVIRAMERKGVRLSVFKPIAQPRAGGDAPDQTTSIVRANSSLPAAEPLKMSHVESLLSSNQKDVLMEEIIANYHANAQDAEVVLVEGLVPTRKHQFAQSLNFEIAKTLNAEIVFVMSQGTDTPEQLNERIELTRSSFGGAKNTNITGVIVNKLNAPVDEQGRTRPDLSEIFDDSSKAKVVKIDPAQLQSGSALPVLGAVPWSFDLIATRAIDMARHLNATIVNEGDINTRRVKSVTFCARSIPHMLEHFRAGSLLVTSADRPDVLVAACLAAMNGVEIGALLLTGGKESAFNIAAAHRIGNSSLAVAVRFQAAKDHGILDDRFLRGIARQLDIVEHTAGDLAVLVQLDLSDE